MFLTRRSIEGEQCILILNKKIKFMKRNDLRCTASWYTDRSQKSLAKEEKAHESEKTRKQGTGTGHACQKPLFSIKLPATPRPHSAWSTEAGGCMQHPHGFQDAGVVTVTGLSGRKQATDSP